MISKSRRFPLVVLGAFVLSLLASGCASHTFVPDEDRIRLERTLPGRTFYLRHAMYIGPFWVDQERLFLTDGVPGEIPWVVNPAGIPIEPGEPTGLVKVGTRVRVSKIEFPTSMAVATRNPFLPRFHPWVTLQIEGHPDKPAPILLLQRELASREAVMAELERFLSPDDPAPRLRQLPEAVLRAVNEKRLVEGMPAEAVAMSWGWPERKTLHPSPEGRREEWIWPFEKRKALIVGGKLVSWEGNTARVPLEAED